jgi:hypothetical protein
MDGHMFLIIRLEIAITGRMKMNDDRHDLTQTQLATTTAALEPGGQLLLLPGGLECLAKIIDITEHFN